MNKASLYMAKLTDPEVNKKDDHSISIPEHGFSKTENGYAHTMPLSLPRERHILNSSEASKESNKIKDRSRISTKTKRRHALISGIAYCISSCSMILMNKLVLSGFKWEAQVSLMLYQNLVSVIIVLILKCLRIIHTEPITWKLIKVWFPANLIFIGMLVSSFCSLKYMQVPMVTVLKNVTNLITALGEMYMFRKVHSMQVWGSLFLMIISALCGGFTDLSFHATGYTWQIINCFFTAGYSLMLRKVMDKAKSCTATGNLNEYSMVVLNNSLSIPLAIILAFACGEYTYVINSPLSHNSHFWFCATLSGLLGLAISFTSMWFLYQTSATTYSLVGSLNKIPLSIAGIVLFHAPTNLPNVLSILLGCFAGVLFARTKMR